MQNLALAQAGTNRPSRLSSQMQHSENVRVEHLQNPPGEESCYVEEAHTLFVSLAPRPIYYVQIQDDKTYMGLYRQGDMLITPANIPLSVRWEGEENCLQVQLKAKFLQDIARETLDQDCDRLRLIPEFQLHNSQIEAIAMMLFTESQQQTSNNRLYLDSLANILAVNLLRHHTTTKPQLPVYGGGLPPRQLQQILDYVDAHLDEDIRLENLAQLLDMSQFHFSRLFKQSIGASPYQYLIQQRVERAKQLLKQTNHSILEIALDCGFNSHSHLTKQFRQVTGMTPKAYRVS